MPISTPSHTVSVTDAAQAVGVSIHSVRRWCEWHAEHLSPEANPAQGLTRRLTGRDIEVLRHIKSLRDTGYQTVSINDTLSGLTFAEIDISGQADNASQETPANALQTAQDALDTDSAIGVALHAIATMQHDMAALKQSVSEGKQSQRDYVQGLAVGFVGALLFVILILLLASIYGR